MKNSMTSCLPVLALLGGMACAAPAQATVTIVKSVGGAAGGGLYDSFDDAALGDGVLDRGYGAFTFAATGGVVNGFQSGIYAAPYVSGANGVHFGNPAGADVTNYLSVGTGTATLALDNPSSYLGLLWGSVDGYNSIELLDASNDVVGLISGSDVTGLAIGDQGVNGTYYVNLFSDVAFWSVRFISTSNAFEFDNLALGAARAAEPGVLLSFTLGLAGLAALQRRRFGLRAGPCLKNA